MMKWQAMALGALLVAAPAACWAAGAEVRQLNGAPALFIDGKPSTGLMLWTPAPTGGVGVANGHLGMSVPAAGRSIATRGSFGARLAAEVTVTMRNPSRGDASAGVKAQVGRGSQYYLALGHYGAGNRVKLWKLEGGTYRCWFSRPWPWEPGKPYRLRLVVDGGRIAGYVDGKLVAEKTDDHPLPPGPLTLLAHHCEAAFDDLRVTSLGSKPAVLLEESFDALDAAKWTPAHSVRRHLREFAAAGVNLVSVPLWLGWQGPGKYDIGAADAVVREVLRGNPDALIMPRISVNAPDWWLREHPDEECQYVRGPDGKRSRSGRQSFSSGPWRRDAGEALRRFIEHVQKSDYADHFIGYHVDAGPCEWFWDWGPGLRDYAPGHERSFRQWLSGRYGGDVERLRAAWADAAVAFDTAQVPSFAQRNAADSFEFIDPAKGRRVIDYREFYSQVVADAVLHFARVVKEQTRREQLFAAFYGYYFFGNECLGGYFDSGHQALARVLASPDVDALCAPHNYQERQPGGCCLPQLVSGSARLHGKLYWDEDDTRTPLAPPDAGYGRSRTVPEAIEVLRRNFACATSLGGTLWWMQQSPGWFSDPEMMGAIGKLQRTAATLLKRDRSSAAEIAVIVNERSCHHIRRSTSLIDPLVADQMVEQVVRIGAPFDTYIAADLARMPDYKLYIMLNALYLTPAQRTAIGQRVCRDGHTVLWVYAPGFVTDKGLSVESVSQLVGMRLRMEPDQARPRLALTTRDHDITRGLPPGLRFGPHNPIGPIFFCDDPKATVLGRLTGMRGHTHYEIDGGPGLAAKDMGTWRSVWCGVPNLPAPLLRGIARWAGVHIYSDQDDVVYASHSLLAIHARHAGQRTVLLPRPLDLADAFTGQAVARGAREFRVVLGCGQTGLWLLSSR